MNNKSSKPKILIVDDMPVNIKILGAFSLEIMPLPLKSNAS